MMLAVMPDDIERRIRNIMADLLRLDAAKIDESTGMDNTEAWDSANHISMVLALEEEFGISFDVAEIEGMTSYFDVVQTVAAKI
jgi:acyl carrier protein